MKRMHYVEIQDRKRTVIFLQAAITVYIKETGMQQLFLGDRHCDILQKIADAGFTEDYKQCHEDGFLCKIILPKDETILFINRKNATEIAKRANYPMIGSVLTSEDLW